MDNKRAIFYSIIDFFPRRDLIRNEYEKMDAKEKRIYKMYVYSICFENEYVKDCIWEYLNTNKDDLSFIYVLSNLAKEYRRKSKKCKK